MKNPARLNIKKNKRKMIEESGSSCEGTDGLSRRVAQMNMERTFSNLIVSDRPLNLSLNPETTAFIDLSALKISNCVGCFGCWIKTPGKCVIRDDAVKVYPKIAACSRLIYVSRLKYGGYDTVMKTMLERAIPVQQAFIRLWQGETHHVQRAVVPKKAVIIGYGEISQEEREIFTRLIGRNAKNMCFESHRIIFTSEEEVEPVLKEEIRSWERS